MILKSNKLLYGIFLVCIPSFLSANITSLQWWDPAPVFNAVNLNMPPDAQFSNIIKKNIIRDSSENRRRFGLNFSPFIQRALRSQNSLGKVFGDIGDEIFSSPRGNEMSDYQGTPYLMGLFLGKDVNGNSIWGNSTQTDTGNVTDITSATVSATLLPSYLQNTVNQLNDTATALQPNAMIYNDPTNPGTAAGDSTIPSIFSEGVLSQDQNYFGAFSTPLVYQKTGLRWELNLDFTDNIGVIIHGGIVQISQTAKRPLNLSTIAPPGSSSLSGDIYGYLNTVNNAKENSSGTGAIPSPYAQANFDQYVTNNMDYLLAPAENGGVDYNTDTFTKAGFEDLQILLFFRDSFTTHPVDIEQYSPMILSPYLMLGVTLPFAPSRDYSLLYSLPFGNNGHTSLGGTMGVTFDFIETIEFGIEVGFTGFIKKEILKVPCPNHILQRVIFPYRRDMNVTPGFNYHFAGIFNATDFIKNTSFVFKYQFIQHTQDSIVQVTDSPYFFPYLLEYLTPWTSQMFTAVLSFAIQPSTYLSVAWQGALSQNNAYVSNTVLGTLSFLF